MHAAMLHELTSGLHTTMRTGLFPRPFENGLHHTEDFLRILTISEETSTRTLASGEHGVPCVFSLDLSINHSVMHC